MNLLYLLLKPLVTLALKGYFRKIRIIGRENIPQNGPTLLIANHPSAFLDPLLVLLLTNRPIHFIAGSRFFGKGLKNLIFRKGFNMIPVHRRNVDGEGGGDNSSMFEACYQRLAQNGTILIFPEGNSVTEYRLRPIKSGTARIKLGAETYMGMNREVKVVPIGLNYVNPHRFYSDVTIVVGKPIDFSVGDDIKSEDKVTYATELIRKGLVSSMLHIDDPNLDAIVHKVIKVLYHTLTTELGDEERSDARLFRLQQEIIEGITFFDRNSPERITEMSQKIDAYLERVRLMDLSDRDLSRLSVKVIPKDILQVLVGGIIALPSLALNLVPYLISSGIFRKFVLPKLDRDTVAGREIPAFAGSMAFAIGLLIFMIWYIPLTLITGWFFGFSWYLLGIYFTFYFLGWYSLSWLGTVFRLIKKIQLRRLFDEHRLQIAELMIERDKIIKELLEARDEFQNKKKTPK